MSAYDCKKNVSLMLEAYRLLASDQVKPEEVNKWIKIGNHNLRFLGYLLRECGINVSEKQKFISTIALLKGVQNKLKHLLKRGAGVRDKRSDRVKWEDLECAFSERIRSGVITNLKSLDVTHFMNDAQPLFLTRVKNVLKKENALKIHAVLAAEFVITKADKEIAEIKYFNTKAESILPTTNLKQWFTTNIRQPIERDIEDFQEKDSGWSLRAILNLCIHFNKYNPMRGSSYVKLPDFIQKKRACINVENFDDECFKWAILSALHPVQHHSNRVSSYKIYENELNFKGIEFPVKPKQVSKFEKQNNISINVYILKKSGRKFKVLPLHITSCKKEIHVNLLLLQNHYVDEKEEEEANELEKDTSVIYHYIWIKNLSRLVSSQLSKRSLRKFVCDRCLHYFYSELQLTLHEKDCREINKCRINLPNAENKILEFKNFNNKEKVPFVVYADFESLLKPIQNGNTYQQHEAFSVGYYLKCSYDDSLSYYRNYRGPSPAKWFSQELRDLAENVETVFWCPIPMDVHTLEQEIDFEKASVCHICEKPLGDVKVRDHCHLTGR